MPNKLMWLSLSLLFIFAQAFADTTANIRKLAHDINAVKNELKQKQQQRQHYYSQLKTMETKMGKSQQQLDKIKQSF